MAKKTPDVPQVKLADFINAAFSDALKNALDPKETTDVMWDGTHITLPAEPQPMALRKAIAVLLDKAAADEQEYDLFERIPGMPLDAAHAFVHVLKERYGWAAAQTKQTWFGPEPPRMQMVKTGPGADEYVEVPVGLFKLHDIDTMVETGFARPGPDKKSQFMDFFIKATVDFADRKIIMDLIADTRDYLSKNSIYKGKALQLSVDEGGNLNALVQPTFIDLSKVDDKALTLNEDIQHLVDVNVMTPIRKTDMCRKNKIPLKRGILLYGPYGTGKTLTALVTAKTAFENGWTFVMVDKADALAQTLEFARQFQPCVVFAEDIDRVVDRERTDDANDIINTIDGAVGKDAEVITVLTTNHIEKMPAVMLRNGRLDALIPINLPNAAAAERLVRYYGRGLIAEELSLGDLGQKMEDFHFIPATIREVVERSKLAMLMNERDHLVSIDLHTAVTALQAHASLLQGDEPVKSPAEKFGVAFKTLLNASGDGSGVQDDLKNAIDYAASEASEASANSNATLEVVMKVKALIEKSVAAGGNGAAPSNDPKLQHILEQLSTVSRTVDRIASRS